MEDALAEEPLAEESLAEEPLAEESLMEELLRGRLYVFLDGKCKKGYDEIGI